MTTRHIFIPFLLGVIFILTGCGDALTVTPSALPPTDSTTGLPSPVPATDTPTPPTDTPVPLAAIINGEPLTLAEFQAELARLLETQAISGTILATDEASDWVMNNYIDQILLAQAAREAGFVVDEVSLQARIDYLATQLGSTQALTDWMAAHGYNEVEFRQALGREMAAAWMRDQIAASVQETADQAHARQILLYNSEQAAQVLALLQSGNDFEALAAEYDPVTGGDLGWFPRGFLTAPAVEESAFSLEPGQYSSVIETPIGYHIVQLVERDTQHLLSPEARRVLQHQALLTWLADRRNQSDIQVLLP